MAKEQVAVPRASVHSPEMAWLEEHQAELEERYAGEWLAIDGCELVAHAPTLEAVVSLAQERGHPHPFISAVLEEPALGYYWQRSLSVIARAYLTGDNPLGPHTPVRR